MNAQPQGYYAASMAAPPPRPPLAGEVRADICVIGGGYTGLSAALHAAQAGARVVLVEGETIGFAASGRNGGQIHPGTARRRRNSNPGSAKSTPAICGG